MRAKNVGEIDPWRKIHQPFGANDKYYDEPHLSQNF